MTLVKVNNPIAKTFDGLMNDLFNDLPANFNRTIRENVGGFPAVNITETNESYQIHVAAPGLIKSDFTIKLEEKLLTISAEKNEATEENAVKTIKKEFSFKKFKRSFTVDEKIDSTNITAQYESGILTVQLPKKEITPNVTKEITVL
jgi:HSP20 family protein